MTHELTAFAHELLLAHPVAGSLRLDVGGVPITVRSSSLAALDLLRRYFRTLVTEVPVPPEIAVMVIEAPPPRLPFKYRAWPRDAAKGEPKEVFADTPEGRVVYKLRSGLCFVSTSRELIAVGPCVENTNQLINFILSQYTSKKLHRGWSSCHAAAVAHEGRGLAIAGAAGRGKSTLALHLLSHGLDFVSNDRLLIRASSTGTVALGVPKMPRVNPGTLLNNPDLDGILPQARRAELSRLAPRELWKVEEKYDVVIERVYGRGWARREVTLAAVLLLNWQTDTERPLQLDAVRLSERRDLLGLLMKAPGVFHRDDRGRPVPVDDRLDPDVYLQALSGVPVVEVTGRVSFAPAVDYCRQLLGLGSPRERVPQPP